MKTSDSITAIGYVRVSTADQAEHGAGLEAQRRAIIEACSLRGWHLVQMYEDAGISAKNLHRAGIQMAISDLERGSASVLVVSKLDRLSRSLMDFAVLMERSRVKGWNLVALDLGVDTSTPQGELLASVMASFAMFERRLIGLRTREGLAVKRSQGVRLGRPPVVAVELASYLMKLRAAGLSYRQIAERLQREDVGPPRGGARWHPNSVRQIVLIHSNGPQPEHASETV